MSDVVTAFLGSLDLLHPFSGFIVGMLVGLTGVGGGSLMTPLLVLLFGVHPSTAIGTDLLYAAVTKTVGTAVHGLGRTVEWSVVRRLVAGSAPATVATLLFLYLSGIGQGQNHHLISVILGFALLLAALSLLLGKRVPAYVGKRFGAPSPATAAKLTVVVGAVLGVLVSISSVGAGALGVTALVMLYPRLPVGRIVGSDIAHAVPLTFLAGLGYWMLGSTDWHLLFSLLIGSIPGIIIGSALAARLPELVIRPVLAATLLLVGGRLVV